MQSLWTHSVTLPLESNPDAEGKRHSLESTHAMIRNALRESFGGFSAVRIYGEWLEENGECFADDSILYWSFCDHDSPHIIRRIAAEAKLRSGQLAVQWQVVPAGLVGYE
jgi:hypothetical protein